MRCWVLARFADPYRWIRIPIHGSGSEIQRIIITAFRFRSFVKYLNYFRLICETEHFFILLTFMKMQIYHLVPDLYSE